MLQKKMLVCDRNLCTNCRLCEMICSAVKTGSFDPVKSRIRVWETGAGAKAFTCANCEGDPVCIGACPLKGLSRNEETSAVHVPEGYLCDRCGRCVAACPYGALVFVGCGWRTGGLRPLPGLGYACLRVHLSYWCARSIKIYCRFPKRSPNARSTSVWAVTTAASARPPVPLRYFR